MADLGVDTMLPALKETLESPVQHALLSIMLATTSSLTHSVVFTALSPKNQAIDNEGAGKPHAGISRIIFQAFTDD